MAKAKHAPLYYATYNGPGEVGYAGDGLSARGYPAGQTVQIGKDDADAIRALVKRKDNTHDFTLDRVPAALIGTAEEVQPTHPNRVHDRNAALAELD